MQQTVVPYNTFTRFCDDMLEGIESAESDIMDEQLGLTENKLTKAKLPYIIETLIGDQGIIRKCRHYETGYVKEYVHKKALFVTKITVFENEEDKLNYLNQKK